MMQEQFNESKHDLQTVSFDSLYSDDKTNTYNPDQEILLKPYSDKNCCDRICLWWFFHTSLGLNTYNSNPNDNRCKCICGSCCKWCLEFKCKTKCCIKEIACCCFTVIFE
jgi:hypothetical protein